MCIVGFSIPISYQGGGVVDIEVLKCVLHSIQVSSSSERCWFRYFLVCAYLFASFVNIETSVTYALTSEYCVLDVLLFS